MSEASAAPLRERRRFSISPLTLLKIEVWMLVLIPNHLVVGIFGGIGSPALLFAVVLFLCWGICVLTPGLGVVRTCVPVRVVLGIFWSCTLLSFAIMNFHVMPNDQLLNSERFLITLVAFSGLALTAAEGLKDRREVIALMRTTVAAVGVMALIGILQFKGGFDPTTYLEKIPLLKPRGDLTLIKDRGGFTRPSSTTLHPIEFGVVLSCTLAFAVHLGVYDLGRAKWKRWLPLGLIALAIPVSVSRSALLVAAVVLVFFFTGAPRALRIKGAAAVSVTLVFIFATVPGMIGTMKGYFLAGNSDDSISSRTSSYAYTATAIRRSLFLGRGPGTYLPLDFKFLDNQYLLTLVEMGFIGLFCLIVLFSAGIWLGRGIRHRSSNDADRNLGQMFAGAACGAFVSAATYDALSFPTFTALLGLFLGLAGAAWCQARAEQAAGARGVSPSDPDPPPRPAGRFAPIRRYGNEEEIRAGQPVPAHAGNRALATASGERSTNGSRG